MRHGLLPRFLLGLAIGLAAMVGPLARPSWASHYAVADVPRLISPTDAAKLDKAGVKTTEELLRKVGSPKDRKALARAAGLSAAEVMTLAQRCDLLRIRGVGPEMVLLLESSGVKTTAELATREAGTLTAAADRANREKKITEKPPTEPQFHDWIEQAKKLAPALQVR